MLTIDELWDLLEPITYRPGWQLTIEQGEFEGIWLRVRAEVRNAYRPEAMVALDIKSPMPPMENAAQFDRWLVWRLERIESHECREWLQVEGRPMFDPHADGANLPSR